MPKINLGKVVGDKGDSFTFDDFTQDQLEGITPKILKGNVTTLEPDENATIDIRKEGLNNYVDFGIPRGKNGAEIRNISASNVELAENNTLDVPTYDDTVGTYTTLETSNEAAEQFNNKIKSGASFLTTLSNAKKSLSAIVQGLKILGTNVGAINGITSDINSESTTIAASSKMVHDLNASLSAKGSTTWLGGVAQQNNAIPFRNLSNYKTLYFRLSAISSTGYDFFTTLDFPVNEVYVTTDLRLVMHLPLAADESVIIWGMFNVSQFYLNSVNCIGDISFKSLDIWGIK